MRNASFAHFDGEFDVVPLRQPHGISHHDSALDIRNRLVDRFELHRLLQQSVFLFCYEREIKKRLVERNA